MRVRPAIRALALIAALPLLPACRQQATAPLPAPADAAADGTPASAAAAQASPQPAPAPPPQAPPQPDDWTLPGAFDPTDTRESLQARFGRDNVRAALLPAAEGEQVHGLVLFPDDLERRLEAVLDGAAADARVVAVTVRERGTRWRMAGLHPGMTLEQLVAANGAPVSFYGFSWDYGGTVADWHAGALANPVGAPSFHHVVLEPAATDAADGLPQGDSAFRNDDTHFPGLGQRAVIGRISVSWPEAGD